MPFFSRFPSVQLPLGGGGRIPPESVAALLRIGWPLSTGISGRIQPEYAHIITAQLIKPLWKSGNGFKHENKIRSIMMDKTLQLVEEIKEEMSNVRQLMEKVQTKYQVIGALLLSAKKLVPPD